MTTTPGSMSTTVVCTSATTGTTATTTAYGWPPPGSSDPCDLEGLRLREPLSIRSASDWMLFSTSQDADVPRRYARTERRLVGFLSDLLTSQPRGGVGKCV